MPRRFVLLDRDGTLIVDRHYLADPEGVELLPGVGAGLRHLRQLGLGLAVITNQSGVGRGYFTVEQVAQVHRRLEQVLAAEQVIIDGIYTCPHTPDDQCPCRKPATGLAERAAAELGFSTRDSFVVGDRPCDVELGRRLGATTFLVHTADGPAGTGLASSADYAVAGISEVGTILAGLLN